VSTLTPRITAFLASNCLSALEVVRLDGAARGHVLGIEVEHHPLAAKLSSEICEPSCEGRVKVGAACPTAGMVWLIGRVDGDEAAATQAAARTKRSRFFTKTS
jgi:hypothetical protein